MKLTFLGSTGATVITANSRIFIMLGCTLALSNGFARGEQNLAPPAPIPTSLTYYSTPGELIGQGQTRVYTAADGSFYGWNYNSSSPPNWVEVDFSGHDGSWWSAEFRAPDRAALTVGDYENAVRAPFTGPGQPGLEFMGNGSGWNTVQGSFQILQIEWRPDGSLLHFAADFIERGDGRPQPLYGRVRYNATVPDPGTLLLLALAARGRSRLLTYAV